MFTPNMQEIVYKNVYTRKNIVTDKKRIFLGKAGEILFSLGEMATFA
jgi:hypothetical protein